MDEYLNNMNKLMEQSAKFTQNINQEMEKGITQSIKHKIFFD